MTILRPLQTEDGAPLRALLATTEAFTPEELEAASELIDLGQDVGTPSGYRFAVAEDDGAVVGYTCYGRAWFSDATWDLYWIAVAPGSQRRGVGSVLLAAAEAAAAAEQGRLMLAETASKPSYEPARRFYERNGYAEIARIPGFYAAGDDKVLYAKHLHSSAPSEAARPSATRVGDSPGRGRGVFAARAFAPGETIELAPVIVFPAEDWAHVVKTVLNDFCFRWGEDDEDGASASATRRSTTTRSPRTRATSSEPPSGRSSSSRPATSRRERRSP